MRDSESGERHDFREEAGVLKLPRVLGISEARRELSGVLDQVEQGETFIIRGAERGGALVISADTFRRLQDAYLELAGELETERILRDEKAAWALRSATEGSDENGGRHALSEVEEMIGENGGE